MTTAQSYERYHRDLELARERWRYEDRPRPTIVVAYGSHEREGLGPIRARALDVCMCRHRWHVEDHFDVVTLIDERPPTHRVSDRALASAWLDVRAGDGRVVLFGAETIRAADFEDLVWFEVHRNPYCDEEIMTCPAPWSWRDMRAIGRDREKIRKALLWALGGEV